MAQGDGAKVTLPSGVETPFYYPDFGGAPTVFIGFADTAIANAIKWAESGMNLLNRHPIICS
jgi:hypothetical protein